MRTKMTKNDLLKALSDMEGNPVIVIGSDKDNIQDISEIMVNEKIKTCVGGQNTVGKNPKYIHAVAEGDDIPDEEVIWLKTPR